MMNQNIKIKEPGDMDAKKYIKRSFEAKLIYSK
jgi:hypothetical protein